MYQEFYMNSSLINLTDNIIKLLKFMTGDMSIEQISLTSDELFKLDRWEYILQSESSRFDSISKSSLDYSAIDDCYFIRVSCALNNDKNQIQKFINFINPYLNKKHGEFLGYIREEDSNEPIILKKS